MCQFLIRNFFCRYDSSGSRGVGGSTSNGLVLPAFDVFFKSLYNHLEKVYKQLLDKTSLMAPLLIKVEEILVATRTQRAPRLSSYYLHWEKELFEAVGTLRNDEVTKHLNGLLFFNALLVNTSIKYQY